MSFGYQVLGFGSSANSGGPLWYGGRGVFMGGWPNGNPLSNIIDYITIATTGDATDFGDLTVARRSAS